MKNNILGTSVEEYSKKLKKDLIIVTATALIIAAVNIVLCILRSEETHSVFLALNILTDIAAVWFIIFYVSMIITPRKKLLSLAKRIQVGEKVSNRIESVSVNTMRVCGLSCYEVICADNRRIYVSEKGKIRLDAGTKLTLTLVENIVVEVECE